MNAGQQGVCGARAFARSWPLLVRWLVSAIPGIDGWIDLGVLPAVRRRWAARELLLSGRAIDAEAALRLGLASRVFPAEAFEAECGKYLARLTAMSRSSLRLSKRLLRRLHPDDFVAKLQAAEEAYLKELMKTPDATEGCAAFLAKRKPVWRG